MQRKNFYAGGIASISAKFYKNGILFNPYSVSDVNIYNASVSGTLITTIVPSSSQVGVYVADWHISSGTVAGTYYDQWTWQGDQSINPQTVTYSISVLSYNNPPTVYTPPLPKKQRGPLFVGHREIDFFNHIGKELIQRIIDQKVIYYSVSEEHTKSHKLYDENCIYSSRDKCFNIVQRTNAN